MNHCFCVFADDLTGACDTGVQFARYDLPVLVLLPGMCPVPGFTPVFDTESRNLPPEEAITRIEAAMHFPMPENCILYKKTDSTLRGNIAEEAYALREHSGKNRGIFTPAFPAQGRVVKNGLLLIHGIAADRSQAARDPHKPVHSAALTDIMTGRGVVSYPVPLRIPRKPGAFAALLQECDASWFCCDAVTDADLTRIARETLRVFPAHVPLWMGSAGLAQGLLRALYPKKRAARIFCRPKKNKASPPVLLTVGSMSTVSRKQALQAIQMGLVRAVSPNADRLSGDPEQERQRLVEAGCSILKNGENALLMMDTDTPRPELSKMLAAFFGDAARDILLSTPVGGFFAAGG